MVGKPQPPRVIMEKILEKRRGKAQRRFARLIFSGGIKVIYRSISVCLGLIITPCPGGGSTPIP
jgi:hypothetical protein